MPKRIPVLQKIKQSFLFIKGHILPILYWICCWKLIETLPYSFKSNFHEWKSVWIMLSVLIWEGALLHVGNKLLKKFQKNYTRDAFFTMILITFFFSFFGEAAEIGSQFQIFNRYVGVDKDYDCMDDMERHYTEENYKVFPNNSKAFEHAKSMVEREGNCFTLPRYFLFWQTAFAQAYSPSGVRSYNQYNSFADYVELAVSVGPLFIIEKLIKAVLINFPIFLLCIVVFGFDRVKSEPSTP